MFVFVGSSDLHRFQRTFALRYDATNHNIENMTVFVKVIISIYLGILRPNINGAYGLSRILSIVKDGPADPPHGLPRFFLGR